MSGKDPHWMSRTARARGSARTGRARGQGAHGNTAPRQQFAQKKAGKPKQKRDHAAPMGGADKGRFTGSCWYCHKQGHRYADCPAARAAEDSARGEKLARLAEGKAHSLTHGPPGSVPVKKQRTKPPRTKKQRKDEEKKKSAGTPPPQARSNVARDEEQGTQHAQASAAAPLQLSWRPSGRRLSLFSGLAGSNSNVVSDEGEAEEPGNVVSDEGEAEEPGILHQGVFQPHPTAHAQAVVPPAPPSGRRGPRLSVFSSLAGSNSSGGRKKRTRKRRRRRKTRSRRRRSRRRRRRRSRRRRRRRTRRRRI